MCLLEAEPWIAFRASGGQPSKDNTGWRREDKGWRLDPESEPRWEVLVPVDVPGLLELLIAYKEATVLTEEAEERRP